MSLGNHNAANALGPEVSVSGFSLSGDPAEHDAYLRAVAALREPRLATELFADAIPRNGAVVHGGAYIGYHTLVAARRVGPHGRVMAFEPNPVAYRALRANVRRNGYSGRVKALPLGIAGWDSPRGRTLSLDSTIGGHSIDVIKLTSAGREVEALRGMRRTLELSPGARLFVECNPRALLRAGSSVAALLGELRTLGLRPQVIDEFQRGLTPVGDWLARSSGPVQLYCAPAPAPARTLADRVRDTRLQRAARRDGSAVPA
jgi:Met-10+ like-protein